MRVVIIGAGGHAKVVLEAVRAAAQLTVIGLVDPAPHALFLLGAPVLGNDAVLPRLRNEGVDAAIVALGQNHIRQRIGLELSSLGFTLPPVVHPSALVSPSARVGAGCVVMARAVIGTDTELRDLVIVNTGAIIDHDNLIEPAAHVAPGCALAGSVRVGARSLLGVGVAVRPGIRIGADAVIGAGSAVVSDVAEGSVVGGTPARPLRPNTRG